MSLVGLVGELALTNGVPQLDGSVSASRHNLTVVRREGHGQNVTGVAYKSLHGSTVSQVPQTESLIPRGRDGKSTVLGDGNVLDNVRVSTQSPLGHSVGSLIPGQVPDNDAVVSGSGKQNVRVGSGGGQRGDPTVVALEGASQHENFVLAHFVQWRRSYEMISLARLDERVVWDCARTFGPVL